MENTGIIALKRLGILMLITFVFAPCWTKVFAQVIVVDKSSSEKSSVYHIRTLQGDRLIIDITPEYQNEGKEKRYDLKGVKLYRQGANEEFQQIISKNNVTYLHEEILIPQDGIYTLEIERGGLKNFNTTVNINRVPQSDNKTLINRKAVSVIIPDTIHLFEKDSVIYDYMRVSTPMLEKDTMPYYKEDQIFLDVAYALRIGNDYVIPIHIPNEIRSAQKKAISVKWGYIISVGDEVYQALKGKIAEVATAAIDIGAGKIMSGKTDEATGLVNKSTLQKGYEIFDKASTANAAAGISGDLGETSDHNNVKVASDLVVTATGFTGLSEAAGNALARFAPKISDKIHWKILSSNNYTAYKNGLNYECRKGTDGYVTGEYTIKDSDEIYYLIIENERDVKGKSFLDDLEAIGKTVLSQYVYLSLKVWVQRSVEVIYDKGYYENTFLPLYNPVWKHSMKINTTTGVIYEDQLKPYYQIVPCNDIY